MGGAQNPLLKIQFRKEHTAYFQQRSLGQAPTATALAFYNPTHHHHQSLNPEGRLGSTDDFITSFLNFSLFSTAPWDLANSRPVHSLMYLSSVILSMKTNKITHKQTSKQTKNIVGKRTERIVLGDGGGVGGGGLTLPSLPEWF